LWDSQYPFEYVISQIFVPEDKWLTSMVLSNLWMPISLTHCAQLLLPVESKIHSEKLVSDLVNNIVIIPTYRSCKVGYKSLSASAKCWTIEIEI
jgi:hypothetical protein